MICFYVLCGVNSLVEVVYRLSDVYVEVTANVKKVVLRMLDHAVCHFIVLFATLC